MKRMGLVVVVCAGIALLAPPANAKGIGYAHFTGPGLPPGGITIHGYFDALSLTGLTEPKMPVPHMSRAQLGPAYPATYHVDYAPHPWLHQVLYPYAKGGPVTFTPGGQHIGQDYESFPGGWYFALSDLVTFLTKQGFPRHDPTTQPERVIVAQPAADAASSGSWAGWPWILLGIGVGLGVGTALVLRRRLRI